MIPVEHFYEVMWKRHLKKYNTDALTYLPYGSSKIFDIKHIHSTGIMMSACLFNDQEPTDIYHWDHAEQSYTLDKTDFWVSLYKALKKPDVLLEQGIMNSLSGKSFLVHSELNSTNVNKICEKYDMIPIYHWYHGFVSRYWFNCHQFDPDNTLDLSRIEKRFLLYARAFTGSREYRLKLIEKLCLKGINSNLLFNYHSVDAGIHYTKHDYKNEQYRCNIDLDEYFKENNIATSCDSSRISVKDFRSTGISIVAETTFDERIFLTEKTCKCFAARHPFVILSGPGTLKLLKQYGFKTFSEFWDESYDDEHNHYKRLLAVVNVVSKINKLTDTEFLKLLEKITPIVEHNYRHFYSKEFENILLEESDRNFSIIKNATPGVFGGSLLRVYDWHARVSSPELLPAVFPILNNTLELLKNEYPDIYENTIVRYRDTIDKIVTSLDSTTSSEEK